jgi:Leucine-rich repeat (LRR) protein
VTTPAAPPDSPAPRDWLDATMRLATSWVGLFSVYAAAVILVLTKFNELKDRLGTMGLKPRAGIALIGALPVLALVFSTIPKFIEQRRIKRYSEITGPLKPGYFTLRPREIEDGFKRADDAHQEILSWIEHTREPVLYLSGASGTGKSSLLTAWVIPKLRREEYVVFQLRGYEDVLVRLQQELLEPGAIWDRPPGRTDDLRSLLTRAAERLGERRLLIVVDQFEEFLILANPERKQAFQKFLCESPIDGIVILLVFRPEYEGLIQDYPSPRMQLVTNRKMISPFTENAAQEFLGKSGLTVNADLMRAVLREAAEIEQTVGLIRPVTINMCGLVLSRFSTGLPRKFRGGLIRGFLKESLSLPEVRDVAEKLIPALITDNVTKHARRINELVRATGIERSAIRACLRRLGESDRAIVRPLDKSEETWEISHDFLVPLLDAIVARRVITLWRRFRPWLPWTTTVAIGMAAILFPWITNERARAVLSTQGWMLYEAGNTLHLKRRGIPPESVPFLRAINPPLALALTAATNTDLSTLRDLKNLTELDIQNALVTEISMLGGLENLKELNANGAANLTDVLALRGLKKLRSLNFGATKVKDVSAWGGLKDLTILNLAGTDVEDISSFHSLTNLTELNLYMAKVKDVSPLGDLKKLTDLQLTGCEGVQDISSFRGLESLRELRLNGTHVKDISALAGLENLKELYLSDTNVSDVSALSKLKNLTLLALNNTEVKDVSALAGLENLKELFLVRTKVTDVSVLLNLKNHLQIFGAPGVNQ